MWLTQIITYTFFLPLVMFSPLPINLGGYMWGDVTAYNRYTYLVPGQIVKWDIGWAQIEPFEGVYAFPPLVQTNCAYYNDHGYRQFINTQNVPTWARMYPLVSYSPPAPAYIDDWIRAVDAMIDYCHPEYLELWNEPDVTLNSGAFWGTAFGDMPGYYAEVIAQAYITLKPLHPEVTFVVGALTLGNEQDEVWIDTVLDMGLMGDALSFHSYNYNPTLSVDLLQHKHDFLAVRTDMPLWVSETALLCKPEWVCDDTFRDNQAAYFTNAYNYTHDVRIGGLIHYSQNDVGWNNCNMVDEYDNIKYPVWYNFSQVLEGVR